MNVSRIGTINKNIHEIDLHRKVKMVAAEYYGKQTRDITDEQVRAIYYVLSNVLKKYSVSYADLTKKREYTT